MQLFSLRLLNFVAFIVTVQGFAIGRRTDEGPTAPPLVDLGYAKYRGVRLGAGIDQFLGMRYAQTPVGSLRFRAPQAPEARSEVQDASNFGPICVGVHESVDSTRAEDCLFVNVFKPSQATERSNLPVWVYIQGGGYANNANANYNGTEVIRESGNNLVFVNFNYRVGVLGFLASDKVRRDGDLNAGLLDQRLLLHWVQRNIRKFGGNPNHVVIHGASAGGGSVTYHLTAYEGKKDNRLFVGAVPESPFWPTQRTVPEVEVQFTRLLQNAKCSDLKCLRTLDTQSLLSAAVIEPFIGAASNNPLPLWYWLPVIDGNMVVDHMYNLFNSGRFLRTPVLVGDDTDEGTYFAYDAANAPDVATFLKNNYPKLLPSQLQSINQAYAQEQPQPKHAAFYPSASAAYGDSTFTCPGNEIASSVARYYNPRRVWNYRYNVLDPQNLADGLGVPHTFETSAIFGPGFAGQAAASYSTINAPIVPVTMRYFISFVTSLNPNTVKDPSAPNWDPWGQGSGQRLKLQTNETAMERVPESLSHRCSLWKSLACVTET